jgi:hypothetical protein
VLSQPHWVTVEQLLRQHGFGLLISRRWQLQRSDYANDERNNGTRWPEVGSRKDELRRLSVVYGQHFRESGEWGLGEKPIQRANR